MEETKEEAPRVLIADPLDSIKQCDAVWQKAVPHFGIYGYEYQWASLLSAIKCNASDPFFASQQDRLDPDFYVELFKNLYTFLPESFL